MSTKGTSYDLCAARVEGLDLQVYVKKMEVGGLIRQTEAVPSAMDTTTCQ